MVISVPIRFINPEKRDDYFGVRILRLSKGCEGLFYRIPFFNTMYDQFLDLELKSSEQIKRILHSVGFLTALFLLFITNVPATVNYAEIGEATDRFAIAPYNETSWGKANIVEALTTFTTAAIYLLGTVMCTVVMFYMFTDLEDSNNENIPGIIRSYWWTKMKIILFSAVLVGFGAMVLSLGTINRFAILKFPDVWVERKCKMEGAVWLEKEQSYKPQWDGKSRCSGGRDAKFPSFSDSTYGAFISWGYYAVLVLVVSWAIMSFTRYKQCGDLNTAYKMYKKRMKTWWEKREIMIVCICSIVKKWDEDDYKNEEDCNGEDSRKLGNPFLQNLFDPSEMMTLIKPDFQYKQGIFEARKCDRRVLNALGTLDKQNYVTWERFVYDFKFLRSESSNKRSDGIDFHFSTRMELSLQEYVKKLEEDDDLNVLFKCNREEWTPQLKNKKNQAWKKHYASIMKEFGKKWDGENYFNNETGKKNETSVAVSP
jgi:hypothetical protein